MRKKKNLWSGVSILIVAVLVITAFIRGNAQAWLLAAAFVIWAVWATYYFLVPYIKEELHKREAKRIRKKCEKQDAAFDRFIIPEVSDPVEQVLLRHANYRISAYLQSVYPNATWEWREEFPERIIAKGGTGRVKLFGVDGYNFADVTFDQNGGINCALVNIVPLKQPNASIAIRCGKENEDCGELADIIKLFVRIRIPADGIYQDAMPQFRRSGVQSDRKRIGGSRSVYKCLYTNPETHGYLTEAKICHSDSNR